MSKRKWLTVIAVIMTIFLVTGCSESKSTQEKNGPNLGTELKEDKPQTTNKLESDADLTKQLEAEKGIERVMVQVVEGEQRAVNVDIEINNEQELSPDQVVEKYSKVIKEKYPDRTIDIIVAKEGKLLKQATLK
ncbi:hypothetical protein [Desulfosporosinus youngiae]|uniref:Uncharacterized protein n=1 Tax=Desulfosporosinus youngiae DSM 17734 TaxID=768710 RepID=H5XZJ7_9FIRM|nr:hypothetical protein [Desulfosporosinus youngiae]EHQ91971.1 hypothetical protein DesyoDRAFT_5036 [Desulfosporosinus youngiae DSM 17734]